MLVLTTLCHLHPIPDMISSKGARRPSETAIFWISDFRTILANWSLIMIWCTAVMEWVSDTMTKNFRRTWIQYTFSSRLSVTYRPPWWSIFSENNKVYKESVTRWYLTYGSATRVSYVDLSSRKMWEFLIFELRWQMTRPKPSYPMIEWLHVCLSFPLRKSVASVMVYEMFVNFSGSSKIQSCVQVSSGPIHIPFIGFEDIGHWLLQSQRPSQELQGGNLQADGIMINAALTSCDRQGEWEQMLHLLSHFVPDARCHGRDARNWWVVTSTITCNDQVCSLAQQL